MEKSVIHFKKENGYPMTIHVETSGFKEESSDPSFINRYWFQSIITDDSGIEISKFIHEDLRGRIHWVDGFFTALKLRDGI